MLSLNYFKLSLLRKATNRNQNKVARWLNDAYVETYRPLI
jgi:hypothetical protein